MTRDGWVPAAVGGTSLDVAMLGAHSCPHKASLFQLRSSLWAQEGKQQGLVEGTVSVGRVTQSRAPAEPIPDPSNPLFCRAPCVSVLLPRMRPSS